MPGIARGRYGRKGAPDDPRSPRRRQGGLALALRAEPDIEIAGVAPTVAAAREILASVEIDDALDDDHATSGDVRVCLALHGLPTIGPEPR
jgi:hypothetical protein